VQIGNLGCDKGMILRWTPLLLSLTLFRVDSRGQGSLDCFSAIPVCQSIYSEENSPNGEGLQPDEIDPVSSCLGGGEVDGQWYAFTVQNGGQFCFSIVPNNLANDYDWAVFDLTDAECADIASDPSLEVSCNFSGTPGVTGANGLGGAQNNACMNVLSGQSFVLYVSNWSQSEFGYSLDLGGGNASIFDADAPELESLAPMNCELTEFEISFNEFVQCSSVQASDFLITGPGEPYTVVSVSSSTCESGGEQATTFEVVVYPALEGIGPFTLGLTGEILDLCGNPSPLGSSLPFNLDPPIGLSVSVTPASCTDPTNGVITALATDGLGPFIYRLNNASPQVNDGIYDELAAGEYTVSVLDAEGCEALVEVEVTLESTMSNTVEVSAVSCHGLEDGRIIVTTTGSIPELTYQWFDAVGNAIRTTLNTDTDSDSLVAGQGEYQIIVSDDLAEPLCVDTLTATIVEPDTLQWLSIPNDTLICQEGTALLSAEATGGVPPISVFWSNGAIGPGPHPIASSNAGIYSVVAVDENGCEVDTQQVIVSVRGPLVVDSLVDLSVCDNVPFSIDRSTAYGGDGELEFLWSPNLSDSSIYSDSLRTGTEICLTVNDGCETPAFTSCATLTVLYTPPLEVTADTTLGCRPFEVAFTLRDTTGGANVLWSFGDGVTLATGAMVSHIYDFSTRFDVNATVTWPNGCITDTTLFDLVEVVPVPTAEFGYKPEPLTIFEPEARFFELAGPNEIGYAWDFFEFGTSEEPEPVITFPNDIGRSYPVQLVVWNELGCADTLLREIPVDDAFLTHIPNTFTPNGDALNEEFVILGNDLSDEEFELNIFDRWGKVVFSSTNPGLGWNGQLPGGVAAQEGVYVWRLKARSLQTLEKRILMGHVTLIR
jgi:gliding motility-associated-like protein